MLLTYRIDGTLYSSIGLSFCLIGIVSILSAAAISTSPSHAFGNAYEVIDPKTAVVNEETVKSDDVKAGVSGIQSLITVVASLKSDLVSRRPNNHSLSR